MTVNELVKEVECKYPNKKVGNNIAFAIWLEDKEIYFIDCDSIDSNLTDDQYNSLLQCKVESYSIHQNYGGLAGKLILRVEVL